MKAKFVKVVVTVLVLAVVLSVSFLPILAAAYQVIYLPTNQYWTSGYGEAHDTRYSYAGARCHSVYPYNGTDLFTKIQCSLRNTHDEIISTSETYTLYESSNSYSQIRIAEGYLDTSTVYFKFRGNSDDQAEAVVSYVGTLIV